MVLLSALSACQDDYFKNDFGPTGEGEVTVMAEVDFRPLSDPLSSRTSGTAISTIDNIWVLVYNLDGELIQSSQYKRDDVTISEEPRGNGDTGTEFDKAEDKTERASFKLKVPLGYYRVYAVANVGDIDDYTEDIANEEKLKAISFKWNNEDITANSQMFGYFSPEGENWTGGYAPNVRIDTKTRKLNAWIRRVASKVTVSFDGSRLRDNISIYVKSVTIKDIPYSAHLGEGNAVKKDDSPKYAEAHSSHSIVYGEGSIDDAEANWPVINKENPAGTISSDHSAGADALFFFENMQGEGIDKEKWQDADGDGKVDFPGANDPDSDDFADNKDGRSLGTYIEVEAFYKSTTYDNHSSGRIFYRFMLGKDTEKDYNAERNHHYKLKLRFIGNANEVDWHIDYEETPGIYTPTPYRISYLYNERLDVPIKIVGNLTGNLRVDILDSDDLNKTSWGPHNPDASLDYYKGEINDPGPWHGFLTMRKDSVPTISGGWTVNPSTHHTYWDTKNLGWREYEIVPKDVDYDLSGADGGRYSVKKTDDGLEFVLPVFTWAKQVLKVSGYTGNNVYTAYERHAMITISGTINGKQYSTKAEIIQVRRVVNPKGVWRPSNSTEPFHAVLMKQPIEGASTFEPVESFGPWSVTITHGAGDFEISADGKNFGSETIEGGKTGLDISNVSFYVRPKNVIGDREVKCGLVRVLYNNNTCVHTLFLRQGYASLDVAGDGIEWHTMNMYDKNNEALSPLEEGSKFKFGNWDDAILATNDKKWGWGVAPGNDGYFDLADGSAKLWTDIGPCEKNLPQDSLQNITFERPSWLDTPDMVDKHVRVARFEDFKSLYENPNIEYGFGVLYGEGAEETLTDINEAYGYERNGENTSSTKGMRGCFVYNKNTGDNVFFPIGVSGIGRRKNYYDEDADGGALGILRYATRSHKLTDYWGARTDCRPLFYDIHKSEGAVYFFEKNAGAQTLGDQNEAVNTAWDINYHTFDFFTFGINATNAVGGTYGFGSNSKNIYGSDACFVRCVTAPDDSE